MHLVGLQSSNKHKEEDYTRIHILIAVRFSGFDTVVFTPDANHIQVHISHNTFSSTPGHIAHNIHTNQLTWSRMYSDPGLGP